MAAAEAGVTAGLDDAVLPFAVPDLDVRGRVVRLGGSIDAILDRHDYPVAVSRVLGEACALTVLLGTAGQCEDLARPRQRDVERLLDDDVLPCGERLLGEHDVESARRADHDDVDLRSGQGVAEGGELGGAVGAVLGGHLIGERGGRGGNGVHEGGDHEVGVLQDGAGVVEPDDAAADEGDAQRRGGGGGHARVTPVWSVGRRRARPATPNAAGPEKPPRAFTSVRCGSSDANPV